MLDVKFDFARQANTTDHGIYATNFIWITPLGFNPYVFSSGNEGSNDDVGIPVDLTPSTQNKMYSIDSPGAHYEGCFDPGGQQTQSKFAYWKRNSDFKEFVRVSYGQQTGGINSLT